MKHLTHILCALALIAGGLLIITDGLVTLFHLARCWQYAFNALYFLALLPACIAGLDLPRRMHPEFCGREVTR